MRKRHRKVLRKILWITFLALVTVALFGFFSSNYYKNFTGDAVNYGFCNENWQCYGWKSCNNGTQERSCVDLNNCGTVDTRPSMEKSCVTPNNHMNGTYTQQDQASLPQTQKINKCSFDSDCPKKEIFTSCSEDKLNTRTNYYFCQYGSCMSETNIETISCQEGFVCSNGECVESQKELTCNDGCELNNGCVNYGYRAGGYYCEKTGMIPQKENNNFCSFDYECQTNLCVYKKCATSQTNLMRFLCLFGIGKC